VSTQPGSADVLVQRLRDTLAARADEPSSVLVHERSVAAQPPSLGILRPRLPAPLARALLNRGITQLYSHQVATVEAVRQDQNVVLASPTASGKSLAFALPTLERVLTQPGTRALYLYPTKALIGDQLRALQALAGALPADAEPHPRVAVLTGDTPRAERVELANNPPAILLANPDILHYSLLPDHRRWRRLLSGLGIVVVDEHIRRFVGARRERIAQSLHQHIGRPRLRAHSGLEGTLYCQGDRSFFDQTFWPPCGGRCTGLGPDDPRVVSSRRYP